MEKMTVKNQEYQTEADRLKKKFAEHDLQHLALRKPALVQRALNNGTQKVAQEFSALTDPSVAISAQLEAAGISKQAQGEQFEAQALMNLETRKFDQKSKEAQFGVAMAMGDEEAFAVRKNLQDSNTSAVSDLRQRTVGLAMQSQAAELSGNFQLAEYYMNNMQAPVSQANSMIAFLTARSIPGIGQMSGFPTTT